REKGLFLAEIATRIIEVKLGRKTPDDKDHYANKRLKLAGSLLAELFRISFRNLTRDLKYQLERITIRRHIEFSIANAIRPGIITERVQHAIATGNWVRGRIGVTQLLDRTNFISTLSHLRRLQSPLSRSQPNLEARDLHPTEVETGRKELYINCDPGRVRRPLIVAEGGRPKLTEEHLASVDDGRLNWQDLVRSGVVELLDADEEENALVAMYEHELRKDHSHLEIAPYVMLGIAASLIPFPEHNQSPRNAYESAMAKQALGVFSTNFFTRVDSRSHLLHYPQTPILQTKPMEVFKYREFEVKGPTKRDSSVTMRPSEQGTIDQIFVTESIEGSKLVKVKVRDLRVPELGDKFASRHGQKGVIGLLVPQEDMPFTVDGVVPDVIINPHAIPSRMTIGQFVETLGGKAASQMGEIMDGTAFENIGPEAIGEILTKLGFESSGREALYNGITGEKLAADLFIGVVYYQKLHHMVSDKMHARARGQVQMLTRQPTEGRARGGGLRFGEMERDCLIGHGASALLRDRLLEESDKYVAYVCEVCGTLAYHDIKQNKYICRIDAEKAQISPVAISY